MDWYISYKNDIILFRQFFCKYVCIKIRIIISQNILLVLNLIYLYLFFVKSFIYNNELSLKSRLRAQIYNEYWSWSYNIEFVQTKWHMKNFLFLIPRRKVNFSSRWSLQKCYFPQKVWGIVYYASSTEWTVLCSRLP